MRLPEYVERLGLAGPVAPTIETLRRLHHAHREAFLFENHTIQGGGAISLAVGDVERKFLDEQRGGYCFEHNTLFAAALRDIGLAPVTLLGRVRRGPPERWCRTHMVLQVRGARVHDAREHDAECWLADVGFGGLGLLEPIEWRDGATSIQGGIEYTLRRDDRLWVLSTRDANGASMDLYEFTDDPQTPWDVEVANHFTSTHPESIFRRTLTIQKSTRHERVILRGDTLTMYRDGRPTERAVEPSRLAALAHELFGVTLPSTLLQNQPDSAAVARL